MSKPIFKFALRQDLLDKKEFLPSRGTPQSTGWDVKAAPTDHKDIVIKAGEYKLIPLGLRAMPPDGWWYQLVPRSSTFAKKHLHCLYGTIDNDFENQLHMAVMYFPPVGSLSSSLTIKFGEAIGQIIPVELKVMEVEESSNEELDAAFTERGGIRKLGGFGSTS
jgi:dUTPase